MRVVSSAPKAVAQQAQTMKLSNRGFSLSELLLAAAILAFVLTGLLLVFINCIILNETNRNLTLAYTAIQAKMEEMKSVAFDNLFVVCPSPRPSNCFCDGDPINNLEGISEGKGRIEISYANYESGELELSKTDSSNLKWTRIVACFKSRNRLIGNDINNCQSSPVELVTLIAK